MFCAAEMPNPHPMRAARTAVTIIVMYNIHMLTGNRNRTEPLAQYAGHQTTEKKTRKEKIEMFMKCSHIALWVIVIPDLYPAHHTLLRLDRFADASSPTNPAPASTSVGQGQQQYGAATIWCVRRGGASAHGPYLLVCPGPRPHGTEGDRP